MSCCDKCGTRGKTVPKTRNPTRIGHGSPQDLILTLKDNHNFRGEEDPTEENDANQTFKGGSFWYNRETETLFLCIDPRRKHAAWIPLSGGSGSGGPSLKVQSVGDGSPLYSQQGLKGSVKSLSSSKGVILEEREESVQVALDFEVLKEFVKEQDSLEAETLKKILKDLEDLKKILDEQDCDCKPEELEKLSKELQELKDVVRDLSVDETLPDKVSTSDDSWTGIKKFEGKDDTIYHTRLEVLAKRTDKSGEGATYQINISWKCVDGKIEVMGKDELNFESETSWGVKLDVDENVLIVRVKGEEKKKIDWVIFQTTRSI